MFSTPEGEISAATVDIGLFIHCHDDDFFRRLPYAPDAEQAGQAQFNFQVGAVVDCTADKKSNDGNR